MGNFLFGSYNNLAQPGKCKKDVLKITLPYPTWIEREHTRTNYEEAG